MMAKFDKRAIGFRCADSAVELDAPWYAWQKKLAKLFEGDPQIEVGELIELEDEETNYAVHITVKSHEKFIALDRAMPRVAYFGNQTLGITLYDAENGDGNDLVKLYETIFHGNPLFKDVKTATDPCGAQRHYVRFQPVVVQFPNDDLSDYSGNWSGLAAKMAQEVFGDRELRGVFFCTADLRENEA